VTDHPRTPHLTLKVVGMVQGSVDLQPKRVLFRESGQQNAQTRVVVLASTTNEPVNVLEVSVDHPALSTAVSTVSDGRTRIDITLDGPLERQRETATLRIHTSSVEDPWVEVPIELYRIDRPRPAAPTPGEDR
jgi:hypothetical protein